MINDRKVVVTGGAGFIGSNLVRELAKRNHVIVIDDLSSGRQENISVFQNTGKVDFFQSSILDLPVLTHLFQGVDYVFHEAAIPSVNLSMKNPLNTHNANVTGTLNVLIAAHQNKVKKVIVASSCAIYGDKGDRKKTESMVPDPQSPYAFSKLIAENYCDMFRNIYGLPSVCLRYFNVYGPNQNPRSEYAAVVPRFIEAISKGQAPVIYGDGNQTRDFIFVEDVVRGNLIAAEADIQGPVNLGNGTETSINTLASMIMQIADKKLIPLHQEPRNGDIRFSLADLSKANSFGFKACYTVLDGLTRTIEKSFEK